MPIIALITDFGLKDWFAGELKGILYGISPSTKVIDLTHEIPPGNIRAAAFVLLASYSSFPPQTIFCCAVGASPEPCRSIAAQTDKYTFIGPDNGVLSWVLRKKSYKAWHIDKKEYTRELICTTFVARDIFGPAAAYAAEGVSADQFGSKMSDIVKIPFPEPSISENRIEGEVIYIDRFGNAITSIESNTLKCLGIRAKQCTINKHRISLQSQYQDVSPFEGLCYPGSAGFLEIGVHGGNAASILEIVPGQKIEIVF